MKIKLPHSGSATSNERESLRFDRRKQADSLHILASWVLPLSMLTMPVVAVEAQYTYTTNSGSVTITGYTGTNETVAIPAVLSGLPVTGIGTQAFAYSGSLTNVTIPNSVTRIEVGAFTDCTKLSAVTIGNGVASIGDNAFFNCSSLAGLTIPGTVTNIGVQAFYGCSSLPTVAIPANVTSLGVESFGWCVKMTGVTIPSSVMSIGEYAFDSCKSLSVITVDALNPSYSSLAGVLFNKNQTTLVQCPSGKTGTYAVPNGVTAIGNSGFRNCNNLTGITIPNSVTNIGASAFSLCGSLVAITVDPLNPYYSSVAGVLFNKSQTTLLQCPGAITGTYALPNSVSSLGSTAFIGCKGLTAITVNPLNQAYVSLAGVLFNKAQTILVQCPAAITGTYTVPNSVTGIGDYAFVSCTGLTSVAMPEGVTEVGLAAFAGCINLTNFAMPASLTTIGPEAFENCTRLSNVNIGKSVSGIGIYAFYQCSSLTSVTIPNTVTDIIDRTFQGCTSLRNVTFGTNVASIGSLAFGFCPNLTGIYFKGNAPVADLAAFSYDTSTVYYLAGTKGWGPTLAGIPTALWNPVIQTTDNGFGVKLQGFSFSITGPSDLVMVVETSNDLGHSSWIPLQTNQIVAGSASFSDPAWNKFSARFYRVRLP